MVGIVNMYGWNKKCAERHGQTHTEEPDLLAMKELLYMTCLWGWDT